MPKGRGAKKQLAHGQGQIKLTDADCVLRLKRWLVDGFGIRQDGEDSRTRHVQLYNLRTRANGRSEEELEAWARPDTPRDSHVQTALAPFQDKGRRRW